MSTIVSIPAPAMPPEPVKRFSVDQYHELIRSGLIEEDDPIELLEGWLIEKMPKNPPHNVATGLVADVLQSLTPGGWHILSQNSITLEDSEPEPDAALVRGKRRDYTGRNPRPADIALVVEVADSTLSRDRGFKKRIYARAGIVHYWILNLIDRQVETFSDPTGPSANPDYRTTQVFGPADALPLVIDGKEVGKLCVADVLP